MISIFTLNLWRYYDFDLRLPNIKKIINNKKPDIIFLQEVQIDTSLSCFSQVEIIKKLLPGYKYSIHSTIYPKEFQRGEKLKIPVQHGMAIISKYPILNSFEYFLAKNVDELEPRSILCFDVKMRSKIYYFANIHFANKEKWAKNQLVEFLNFIHSRGEKRIMAGDFNLYDLPKYSNIFDGYSLSYNYKPYRSYLKDNGCLDYIMIPNNFQFTHLEVIEEHLSDHKGLFVNLDGQKKEDMKKNNLKDVGK